MVQAVFGGCCITAAGRGLSPTLYVGIAKVLLASIFISYDQRKMCGKPAWTQDRN